MFQNNNSAISCYTSFSSYDHLIVCFNFLGNAVNHLKYPGTSSNAMTCLVWNRTLTINEFFQLKRGLSELDLAYRFHISQSSVSHILTAWVNLLYKKFLEVPIWPSREQVDSLMPREFKEFYPNTRIIIDATEIFIQRPSDPRSQQITFSTYKNHNTAKALSDGSRGGLGGQGTQKFFLSFFLNCESTSLLAM